MPGVVDVRRFGAVRFRADRRKNIVEVGAAGVAALVVDVGVFYLGLVFLVRFFVFR